MRPSLHDDGHRRYIVGEPGFGGRVQRVDDRMDVVQRLERRKCVDVVARRYHIKKTVWKSTSASGAVRNRHHHASRRR